MMDNKEKSQKNFTCQLTKGIFVQKKCETKAFVVCATCRRPVCTEHIDKSASSRVLCLECAAQEYLQQQTTYTNSHKQAHSSLLSKTYDDFWYYTTRLDFVNKYHFQPFSHTDYAAFDTPLSSQVIEDEHFKADTNSFLDS